MTDEQKKELLDLINLQIECVGGWMQGVHGTRDKRILSAELVKWQALRRLVEKFAEWQTLTSKLAEARELMWTEQEILDFDLFEDGE